MEHARQPDPTEVLALRHRLRAAGYSPIPLYGKTPPVYGKNNKRKGWTAGKTCRRSPANRSKCGR
jgi:hypothetical protein